MRKMLVIAVREYNAAVRTKAFVIGLLIMPLFMGGSLIVQALLKDVRDTKSKQFAVVDRTRGKALPALQAAVDQYNSTVEENGKQVRPRFELLVEKPSEDSPQAVNQQRLDLSSRIRSGELFGVVEIGPDLFSATPGATSDAAILERSALRYQSNRPTFMEFSLLAEKTLTREVRQHRAKQLGKSLAELERWMTPVALLNKGLTKVDESGTIKDAGDESRIAPFIVPFVLMMLMFMLVMMSGTPLMQSVVEEKMQRIAEVLLGSVTPFQMMMGKLLGMTAVSLTISGVYLGGAYWTAYRYDLAEYAPISLLAWFLGFQALAALMYGSLFIAIGAACSDIKETQNLLWPVMLVACLPMFVIGSVLQEPNGPVATGLSFFPFATPTLMIARQAIPPGIPLWQPLVGGLLVLATTIFCVYAASRIFRVGILLQGKGVNLLQLMRWVFRG